MVARRRGGTTLLELLLAAVLFIGISAILITSLFAEHRFYLSSQTYIQVQWEARRALDAMERELYGSGNVRRAGDPVGGADFAGETQVDFQIERGFDQVACGGICWGDETATGRWLHVLRNASSQLVRCSTLQQADPIDFSTCRVLANYAQTFTVDYQHSAREVRIHLRVFKASSQLPGGGMGTTPVVLTRQIRLRNS